MDIQQFEGRKRDHLRHALNPAHQATGLTGLDRVRLRHEALPELNFDEVSLAPPVSRLGGLLTQPSRVPFYVSGMTAGHADAPHLNRVLARACARTGWLLGVGSQRRELTEPEGRGVESVDSWGRIRAEAPEVVLLANIGLSQIIDAPVSGIRKLVEGLGARALAVHANALQETLQPEGTPRFRGAFPALARLIAELGYPVVLKETGCGFSRGTLERLRELDLAAIDVAGLGGTHWGRIEGARSAPGTPLSEAAATFADWGVSTVDSVIAAASALKGGSTEIWASGGVRTGLDAAKLIALGADRVGFAKPALEAALEGEERLVAWMQAREYELRISLFCTGSRGIADLRGKQDLDGTKGGSYFNGV